MSKYVEVDVEKCELLDERSVIQNQAEQARFVVYFDA